MENKQSFDLAKPFLLPFWVTMGIVLGGGIASGLMFIGYAFLASAAMP